MTPDTLHAVLADALLAGAVAAAASVGVKTARFYNLSLGVWVIVGGWLGASLRGFLLGADVPAKLMVLLVMCLAAFAHVTIATEMLRRARHSSEFYLLVTLGISMVLSGAGERWLLRSAGATIPFSATQGSRWVFVVVAALAPIVVALLLRSHWWSETLIRVRLRDSQKSFAGRVAIVLGVELALLMLLGAAAQDVHKGAFGSAPHLTLTALLAVAACRGRPLMSFAVGAALTALANFVHLLLPNLPQFSWPAVVVVLLIGITIREVPPAALVQAAPVSMPTGESHVTLAAAAFALLLFTAVAMWDGGTTFYAKAVWLAVLTIIAFTGRRLIGVSSIAWPACGAAATYLYLAGHQNLAWLVAVAMVFVLSWALYFLLLRTLTPTMALLVDLSCVAVLFAFAKTSRGFVGNEELREVPAVSGGAAAGLLGLCLVGLVAIAACALLDTTRPPKWARLSQQAHRRLGYLRARVLATQSFTAGYHQGLASAWVFVVMAAVGVAGAGVATFCFHMVKRTITPTELSVVLGVEIFLFAALAETARSLVGALSAVIVLHVLLEAQVSAFGNLAGIVIGGGIAVLPWLAALRGHREHA